MGGCQGGCEQRIEVIVSMQIKQNSGGRVSGWGGSKVKCERRKNPLLSFLHIEKPKKQNLTLP